MRKTPAVRFGRFTLLGSDGGPACDVLIAPGRIIVDRDGLHDLSYLTVWTPERTEAVGRELLELGDGVPVHVGAATPELQAILQRLLPACSAVFVSGGTTSPARLAQQLLPRSSPRSIV